ncbi:MAG: isoprenyl transferase [Planctomycetaceae bacterium]
MTAESPYSDGELAERGLVRERLPRHVAIIMDGNGRWARSRGLPRIEGHRRGVVSVRTVVEECARLQLDQLTLYCFSSENWKRPPRELELLMSLLRTYVVKERDEIMRQNIRFCTIGRSDGLSPSILAEVQETIDLSQHNSGMRLCLALNYGSRIELVDAMRRIARLVQAGEIDPETIDESTISDHLYTAGMGDPDLVIRTSGEMRVSNFLLWQISYAELWVTENHWPAFREADLYQAFRNFASRDRRFGGLSDPSNEAE